MQLPTIFELPWGYTGTVALVEPNSPELEDADATWDVDKMTIWIDKTKPIAEKRWLFMHELNHAFNDWTLWVARRAKVKVPDGYEGDNGE